MHQTTLSRGNRQPTDQEKTVVNHVSDKGLKSKIIKEVLLLKNNKKQRTWLKNRWRTWLRHFIKEDIQMDNKHTKKCSVSLVIRKRQLKTTIRYHFISTKMVIIKKTMTSISEDVKTENAHTLLMKMQNG